MKPTVYDFVKDIKNAGVYTKERKDGYIQLWYKNKKTFRHLADMKDSRFKLLFYIKNIGCDQTSFAITNENSYKNQLEGIRSLIKKIDNEK